jgi:hypothetical protein
MEETKPWYTSRTIWASIIQVGVGVGVSLGVIGDSAGAHILAEGPDLVVGLAVGVAGVLGIWGRIKATKTIG